MKKTLVLIITFLTLLSLFACTDKTEGNISATIDTNSSNNESATTSDSRKPFYPTYFGINNGKCKFLVTGFEYDTVGLKNGIRVLVEMENRSTDKTYYFSVENVKINGVECMGVLSKYVSAGKEDTGEIFFFVTDEEIKEKADEEGIGYFTDIEITFVVEDGNSYNTIAKEKGHIYPYGEDEATKYVG